MFAKVVKKLKSKVVNNIVRAVIEVYLKDEQQQIVFTLPGYESKALDDQKMLAIPTDKSGKMAVFGVPLETDIEDGERRVTATDTSGIVKGKIYLKKDGLIEVGLLSFSSLLKDSFIDLFNAHVHVDSTGGSTLAPSTQVVAATVSTSKLKAE